MKGLHPDLARVIEALGITKFNDVQKAASKGGLYTKTGDYALVSQSRTGKSFAGSLLVANEMFKQISEDPDTPAVSIFIAPFHASARETSNLLSQLFGWFLRPLVLVGEIRQSEIIVQLSKGLSPNVIIATPGALQDIIRVESARKWLLERKIVTVIYDDVHSILHDPNRGSMLLEISDFFTNCLSCKPRSLVLSAVFDNPERLEKLFNVKLLIDTTDYKPPTFNLIKYTATGEKKENLDKLLEELAEQGQRTLVYMKMISNIENLLEESGKQLIDLVTYDLDPLVRSRLEKIAKVLDELGYPHSEFITRGIGCYHGQMDDEHRWFVEWAFRRKHLRFLFGTESLAYGVNTPVSHVVMESPGIDEIFRQSMMARAVRLRKGFGKPGTCTVFTKTIKSVKELERVYFKPTLPVRFINNSNISKILLGMIGLGLIKSDADRKSLSDRLGLLFKKGSTERVLKELSKIEPVLIEGSTSTGLTLTPFGEAAFHSGLSAEQSRVIIDGIEIIASKGEKPTEFDLLLIINAANVLEKQASKTKKELDEPLQKFLEKSATSVILSHILDTDAEIEWRIPIENASLVYTYSSEELSFEQNTRRSIRRLIQDVQRFTPNLVAFLVTLKDKNAFGEKKEYYGVIKTLLSLLDSKRISEVLFGTEKSRSSFRGKDLTFIDFGDIEKSIDSTLTSNLSPQEKIQLLDLLDTVENTTSAFVDLLSRSKDDAEANAALTTVLNFSKEGRLGSNLVRALEEEGVVERGTMDGLMNSFSERVEEIQARTDAPAKAAKVLISLFTGDVVGLATGGVKAAKLVLGRARGKVDTSNI
ncbi:DEAD/DEAH box helicase [Candidatus Thorarchaeota archaeon]|nr:MAG: DEAD/DEAH box helicase [Candidatus Thorarchaeota archaeon]